MVASGVASKGLDFNEIQHVIIFSMPKEIEDYVQSGEPMDKAGGYAIQGRAARWIPRIQGCYFNVVGLPLAVTAAMLETALVTGKQPSEKAIQF